MVTGPTAAQLAALADVVLDLAHALDVRQPGVRDRVALTGTEIAVLREVHRAPRATPSLIAAATGLRRSRVSTALGTLEARGLVVREHLPDDARAVALVPTDHADRSVARIHEHWAALLGSVEPETLHAAVDATTALADVAAALRRRP